MYHFNRRKLCEVRVVHTMEILTAEDVDGTFLQNGVNK